MMMSPVEASTNALRHSEGNCSGRVSDLWLQFKAPLQTMSCGGGLVLVKSVTFQCFYSRPAGHMTG